MCLSLLVIFFSLQKKWDVILGGSGAQFLFAFFVFGLCVCFSFLSLRVIVTLGGELN